MVTDKLRKYVLPNIPYLHALKGLEKVRFLHDSQRHDPPEWFGCWEIYVSPAGHSSTTHQE